MYPTSGAAINVHIVSAECAQAAVRNGGEMKIALSLSAADNVLIYEWH